MYDASRSSNGARLSSVALLRLTGDELQARVADLNRRNLLVSDDWRVLLHHVKQLNDAFRLIQEMVRKQQEIQVASTVDSAFIMHQLDAHQSVAMEVQERRPDMESCIETFNQFSQLAEAEPELNEAEHDVDNDMMQPASQKRAQRAVHALKKRWIEVQMLTQEWHDCLSAQLKKLQQLDELVHAVRRELHGADLQYAQLQPMQPAFGTLDTIERSDAHPIEPERYDQLRILLDQQLSVKFEQIDEQVKHIQATDLKLSPDCLHTIIDLKSHWKTLAASCLERARQKSMPEQSSAAHLPVMNHNVQLASASASVSASVTAARPSDASTVQSNASRPSANLNSTSGPMQQQLILLAYSVESPWERTLHPSGTGIPFYKNRQTGQMRWDHPLMTELLNTVQQFNYIRFAAYRTAMKLRVIQKHLYLDKLTTAHLKHIFQAINETSPSSQQAQAQLDTEYMDVPTLCNYLILIYSNFLIPQSAPTSNGNGNSKNNNCSEQKQSPAMTQAQLALRVDLALNWFLNVFDTGRSGRIRSVAFKIVLILLCNAQLEEKYVYLFRVVADRSDQSLDANRLSLLLHEALQLTRQLGEIAAFGGSNTEPSVRSCSQLANGACKLSIRHFLSWANLEPQSLVWLAVLHRLVRSESARHVSARCTVCKQQPIIGLRYRCLRCFSVDLCQTCFFAGRACKSHKVSHPTQEYCSSTSAGADVRDLTRICCNRLLKPAKGTRRRTLRLGYLPVQTVHEGSSVPESPLESPQLPPFDVFSQRVPVPEPVRAGNSMGVSSMSSGSDEHELIGKLCSMLTDTEHSQSQSQSQSQSRVLSPLDVLHAAEQAEADELDLRIRNLEEENRSLQKQRALLLRTRAENANAASWRQNGDTDIEKEEQLAREEHSKRTNALLNEANALRAHKARMESRLTVLEQHNAQLEVQLDKIKLLLSEHQIPLPNACYARQTQAQAAHAGLNSATHSSRMSTATSSSSMASTGAVVGVGRSLTPKATLDTRQNTQGSQLQLARTPNGTAYALTNGHTATAANGNSLKMVGSLFMMADEVGRAVGDVVNAYTDDEESSELTPKARKSVIREVV